MTLHIQNPDDPNGTYLIDELRLACDGAIQGAGAYAFMSVGGVKLFFQDEVFSSFMEAGGSFSLVAGVDAITGTKAIGALDSLRVKAPRLTAKVHIPSHSKSIYHPKLAWFRKPNGGVLLTGSGNLTAGGLRWNVEAFSVEHLSLDGINQVQARWNAYLQGSQAAMYDTNHPAVVARLKENDKFKAVLKASKVPVEPEVVVLDKDTMSDDGGDVDVDAVPAITPTVAVLVAEIPKSGDRWKQANFDLDSFINFFGASKSEHREALFFNVLPDGSLAPQEVRPAVAVQSQNYRFELNAAAGLTYPANGRPIGVFVRIAARTFLYVLTMPGLPGHQEMLTLLDSTQPIGHHLRRIPFNAADVMAAWPQAPLWQPLTLGLPA